ncbi:hypothetical protein MN116_005116 [Schistosoma mekongi]|uniref:Uncharacterized protein n=1 Tax=Schistosoma mekongi TaxID=38744 RepID=A0AAE2D589_SCHME|nr:hypothetical protein MN116_005116 [Schistosoma mekongi]
MINRRTLEYFAFLILLILKVLCNYINVHFSLCSVYANDFVLPQTVEFSFLGERDPLLQSQQKKHDVVSAYLKRKRKSLYTFLTYLREFTVPLHPK